MECPHATPFHVRRLFAFRRCRPCATFTPALALDMPQRKAGLWELKTEFQGGHLPARTMRQCIDAASDKLMNGNFAAFGQEACSKRDIKSAGGTITVDSVCKFGATTTTSHAVVSGSFDSAYTVEVTSTRMAAGRCPAWRRAPPPT
jgi:Protein of unknown function (DUF3617)